MTRTRTTRHIRAHRAAVYRALVSANAGDGTDVVVVHEGIPPGVSAADNEIGTRLALDKLAALVESTAECG